MPRFSYSGRDSRGLAVSGEIEAADRRVALRRLAEKGLRVSEFEEGAAGSRIGASGGADAKGGGGENYAPRGFGPHPVAVAFFENYRELLAGGLPPGDAVRLMAQRVTEPSLRALCGGLWRDLAEGAPLAEALARRPALFGESVIRLVEAGEHSGGLEPVIRRILEDYARQEALRTRIIGALGYPIFVGALAMLVLSLFVFWIMPRMEGMMVALGGDFPWTVKVVMALAVFMVKAVPVAVILGVCAAPWLRRRRSSPAGCREQDALLLRVPLLGRALVHAESARLAELLSTLLGSGLNATDALRLAERPIANAALRERFAEVRRQVNDGAAFAVALREAALFEAADLDLISVGENAGAMPRAFGAIAERRRRALDVELKRMVTVATAVFLGGAVGLVFFCLLSIVTTILGVSQGILHR